MTNRRKSAKQNKNTQASPSAKKIRKVEAESGNSGADALAGAHAGSDAVLSTQLDTDEGTLTDGYRHIPVLLNGCIESLALRPGCIYLDATLGLGGHAEAAARIIGSDGILIGIDQDAQARKAAANRLYSLPDSVRPQIYILDGNFGDIDELLVQIPIPGVDAVLFDLGMSSMQIDDTSRGFTFKADSPLDMRMDPSNQTLTAAEVLNTYNAADLTRIIRNYSDEKWASRIAQFIVEARGDGCGEGEGRPFETSGQLVDVIKAAIPASARRAGGHPAKRTFQALRMEVNDEVGVLKRALDAAIRWVNPQGRVAAISYHSIEDRIVKEAFAAAADRCVCPPDLPVCACGLDAIIRYVNKKPIVPDAGEIDLNPRARSAKLRVVEKL